MNSTNALPAKLDRVTCVRCRISAPTSLMRVELRESGSGDEVGDNVCANEAACRKRERKRDPKNAAPPKRTKAR